AIDRVAVVALPGEERPLEVSGAPIGLRLRILPPRKVSEPHELGRPERSGCRSTSLGRHVVAGPPHDERRDEHEGGRRNEEAAHLKNQLYERSAARSRRLAEPSQGVARLESPL